MTDKRIIAEIERRMAVCEASYIKSRTRLVMAGACDEHATLKNFRAFILALPPDDLADAQAEVARLRDALKKISEYRSNDPYFNMIIAIAGDIVEPMEVVPSAALDAKIGELK